MQPEASMTIYFHYAFGGYQLILLQKFYYFVIEFITLTIFDNKIWYFLLFISDYLIPIHSNANCLSNYQITITDIDLD